MVESAWAQIMERVRVAPYPVRVLAADPGRARACLARLEISERSWLGALVANSAGLVIDHGWLRVLGSGTDLLPDVVTESRPQDGLVVVAYDVLGGHFIWAAATPAKRPTIHYFGPDTLDYTDLDLGYAEWLQAMLGGATTDFYRDLRWHGWQVESASTALDQGIHLFPPPSTVEGKDLNTVSRRAISLKELVSYYSGSE
jgi:uncharacterized protein DUF2625